MIKRAIGFLLWLANSNPPKWGARERFYQMKDTLLRKFGKQENGYDIQHIKKECWTCDGTGIYEGNQDYFDGWVSVKPQKCYKCNNGVYEEFLTKLERWNIGGYSFHLPVSKSYMPFAVSYDKNIGQIEGYIRHKSQKYYLADEALYWLALFFDWKLFKMTFGHCGHVSKKFTPMVIFATAVFKIKIEWREVLDMPRKISWWVKRKANEFDIDEKLYQDSTDLPF